MRIRLKCNAVALIYLMKSRLERIPVEIWDSIVQEACPPDDSTTAFALSLTSRFIHTVSEEYHVQSLCLGNITRILEFADYLDLKATPVPVHVEASNQSPTIVLSSPLLSSTHCDIPSLSAPPLRATRFPCRFRHVRHLFIRYPGPAIADRVNCITHALTRRGHIRDQALFPWLFSHQALERIFNVLTRDGRHKLRTVSALSYSQPDNTRSVANLVPTRLGASNIASAQLPLFKPRLPNIPTPVLVRLSELTITWVQYISETVGLPSLKRLTLLFGQEDLEFTGNRTLKLISGKHPVLTHLRLTPLILTGAMLDDIMHMLTAPSQEKRASSFPDTFPKHLEQLVLETESTDLVRLRQYRWFEYCC